MKLVSWNVNGLRACVDKGFYSAVNELEADVICLQETKLQSGQLSMDLPGYHQYWSFSKRPGYSGTAVFTKVAPISQDYFEDNEGRVVTLEFESFYLVNVYTPNSKRDLSRLDERSVWDVHFTLYISSLEKTKPVVLCGDLNVAHEEIDLARPDTNHQSPGFTYIERMGLQRLLDSGYIDSFRSLYPDTRGAYTWWSYMANSRERNVGWRLDYFLVSSKLSSNIRDARIHSDIYGSDHCPISLELEI